MKIQYLQCGLVYPWGGCQRDTGVYRADHPGEKKNEKVCPLWQQKHMFRLAQMQFYHAVRNN